jgi:hypothetical protein
MPYISLPCHFSPGRWRQQVSPKRQHQPTHQHSAKTQKIKKTQYASNIDEQNLHKQLYFRDHFRHVDGA